MPSKAEPNRQTGARRSMTGVAITEITNTFNLHTATIYRLSVHNILMNQAVQLPILNFVLCWQLRAAIALAGWIAMRSAR